MFCNGAMGHLWRVYRTKPLDGTYSPLWADLYEGRAKELPPMVKPTLRDSRNDCHKHVTHHKHALCMAHMRISIVHFHMQIRTHGTGELIGDFLLGIEVYNSVSEPQHEIHDPEIYRPYLVQVRSTDDQAPLMQMRTREFLRWWKVSTSHIDVGYTQMALGSITVQTIVGVVGVSGRWREHGAVSFAKNDPVGSKIEDRGF